MNLQDATGTALLSWLSAYQCDRSLTITLFISAPPRHHTTKPCVVSPREALRSKLAGSVHLSVLTPIALILRQTCQIDVKIIFVCLFILNGHLCVLLCSFDLTIYSVAALILRRKAPTNRCSQYLLPVSLNHVSSSFFFYNKLICHYLSLIISLVTDAHTHDSQISRPLNGLLAAGKLPQVVRMIIRRAFWKVLHVHQRCRGLCRVQSEKKELKWLSSVESVEIVSL